MPTPAHHPLPAALLMQRKTGRPVQFEITEQTRESILGWIRQKGLHAGARCSQVERTRAYLWASANAPGWPIGGSARSDSTLSCPEHHRVRSSLVEAKLLRNSPQAAPGGMASKPQSHRHGEAPRCLGSACAQLDAREAGAELFVARVEQIGADQGDFDRARDGPGQAPIQLDIGR